MQLPHLHLQIYENNLYNELFYMYFYEKNT